MDKFADLKLDVQEIIDLFANKQLSEAQEKLITASEKVDDLIDFSEEDEDLMEISRYQVLLNQLHQKINALN
jgi:tRNA U34 5-carboxymethylaminomethyl modifying GTPase MnmE/TrmE